MQNLMQAITRFADTRKSRVPMQREMFLGTVQEQSGDGTLADDGREFLNTDGPMDEGTPAAVLTFSAQDEPERLYMKDRSGRIVSYRIVREMEDPFTD